jgi:alkylated DNA repair dioxygenase AlkB
MGRGGAQPSRPVVSSPVAGSSMAERLTLDQEVPGSSPGPPAAHFPTEATGDRLAGEHFGDGCFELRRGFLAREPARALLVRLVEQISWERPEIVMFGRLVPVPRLTCWMAEFPYRYSGTTNAPHAEPAPVAEVRERIEVELGFRFNCCLANYYRDGQDSMGWHADDEPELGPEPVIASLSLGATRDLLIRRRDGSDRQVIPLADGDLLVMSGHSQSDWRHSLPRRAKSGPRLNLTFRWFVPARRGSSRACPERWPRSRRPPR